jgi:DNA helicase-2/ATP-dependent DNA helicase PcrA
MSGAGGLAAEAMRDMLARITIHAAATERAEAEFVVATIEQAIGGHSFFSIDSGRASAGGQAELGFADFAVLYRTDAQADALIEAFARSGIPFRKHTHTPLAEHPAVPALLSALRNLPDSVEPLHVTLAVAAEQVSLDGDAFNLSSLQTVLRQLVMLAETCGNDRNRFVEAIALASEADFWDPRADCVSLLTLHAAKGLEFPVVFIIGIEDGILPLRWGTADEASLREERRLFYVGMTRAKDRLFLTRAVQRPWRGQLRELDPSPFLNDIEAVLLDHHRTEMKHRAQATHQLELF